MFSAGCEACKYLNIEILDILIRWGGKGVEREKFSPSKNSEKVTIPFPSLSMTSIRLKTLNDRSGMHGDFGRDASTKMQKGSR